MFLAWRGSPAAWREDLVRVVGVRIRRLLNVESGLNDGIATPFVLVAIAGAATAEHAASTGPGKAVAELGWAC